MDDLGLLYCYVICFQRCRSRSEINKMQLPEHFKQDFMPDTLGISSCAENISVTTSYITQAKDVS